MAGRGGPVGYTADTAQCDSYRADRVDLCWRRTGTAASRRPETKPTRSGCDSQWQREDRGRPAATGIGRDSRLGSADGNSVWGDAAR